MKQFSRNLNHVRSPHTQVQPLIPQTSVALDLNCVDKRPSLPVVIVCGERRHPIGSVGDAKWPRARRLRGITVANNEGTYSAPAPQAAPAWANRLRRRGNRQRHSIRSTDIASRRIATVTLPRRRVSAPLHRETVLLDATKTASEDCYFAIPIEWPTQAPQCLHHRNGSGHRTRVYVQCHPEPATDRSAFPSAEHRRNANVCARRHSVQGKPRGC